MKKHNKKRFVAPSSRPEFGKEVTLPKKFCNAFHLVFEDLYGKEMELFVQELNDLMDEVEEISEQDLNDIRKKVKEVNLYEFQKSPFDRIHKNKKGR